MTKFAPLAILATAVLALTSCGSDDSDRATDATDAGGSSAVTLADLEGTTFEAASPDALSAKKQQLVEGSPITVGFDEEGNLQASAGCNGMGAAASVDGGRLELDGGLVGTEMACEDEVMAQERWLSTFLTSSPEIALDGDTLTLSGDAGTLTLTAAEGAEAPADPDAPDDGVSSVN